MKHLWNDIRYALRQLRRSPGFTAVVVVSLALGIGANAAIFSLFDQLLLRPLPVHEPELLVNLSAPGPKPGSTSCNQAGSCEDVFSYAMFRDLEAEQDALAGLAAHVIFGANLATGDETVTGDGMLVSGQYFPLLGVQPVLGRLLGPDDDVTVGGHPVTVLSYDFWLTRMGADPGVLDTVVTINGHTFTIVGVAPPGFFGTTLGARPDVYVPLTMRSQVQAGFSMESFQNRRSYWAYVFGRLRPEVPLPQATQRLNSLYGSIINDVEAPLQEGMTEQTLAQFRAKELSVETGPHGQSDVHDEAGLPLLLLLGITAMVLIIACANIANLLLARGAGRAQEMAVRGSMGAGRRRLVLQLLTEAGLLALMGGALSLVVAYWTLWFIGSILPPFASAIISLQLEPSVLLFAGGLAVATGLLFGLYPALQATRPDLVTTLKDGGSRNSGSRGAARFRAVLVTAQIALSMTLLVSSGLFLQSLVNVTRVDLGMDVERVATFRLSPVRNGYESERSQILLQRVEEELAALPGVTAVSSGMVPLLSGSNWGTDVSVEGFEGGPAVNSNSRYNQVGPGYFRTLGMPLLSGREFTEADVVGAPRVAVVNETFARQFDLDPRETVGKFMATGGSGQSELDIQIVGLVQDANYSEVKQEVPPLFFLPARQSSSLGALTFYARTGSTTEPLLRAIPGLVRELDPNLPVEELKTLEQQASESVFMDRMITTLSSAFALLATLLAALGLYGVLAYTVTQRTREIGVRMALGAEGRRVRNMILKQIGWMTAVGGFLGILAAFGLGRAVESLLFGVSGGDPWIMLAGCVTVVVVAFSAGYLPARRASLVDPMISLRAE
ncbi:MAG: ABC transporter permease [Gemmatimonadota bacterium]